MQLRYYQQEAVDATYKWLANNDGNPLIVIPTGGGKTPVLATICRDISGKWGGRVAVLSHVKELVEQAADKLRAVDASLDVGINSAGVGRRDTQQPIICAGIQSVYKRAFEFDPFDMLLVDECHLIPPDGEGMYRTFLADCQAANPRVRIVGLTATPYRTGTGLICGPDNLLSGISYEIGVKQLIHEGFLSPLISKAGTAKADTSQVPVQGGEFVASPLQDAVNTGELVSRAVVEIADKTADRNSILVFSCGVEHGQHVTDEINAICGPGSARFVDGKTSTTDREKSIEDFKSGALKFLVNHGVFTTGFDAPNVDCVVILRPTLSPGLFYQMVGRGFRLHPGKSNCLVLDFGGNIARHGPVDQLGSVSSRSMSLRKATTETKPEPKGKECSKCQEVVSIGYTKCPSCGEPFPVVEKPPHAAQSSTEGVLSGQFEDTIYDVTGVDYSIHFKGGNPDATPTMRVDYECGIAHRQSEWVCFEHDGFALRKAKGWWADRSNEPWPETVRDAVCIAQRGGVAEPSEITVRCTSGERFDRIIDYKLGEKPALLEIESDADEFSFNYFANGLVPDDIPF